MGNRIATKTDVRLLTKEEVARALTMVELSPEEEVVIRLRYGISMQPEEKLSTRGGGNEELEARLALMEKWLLDRLEERQEGHSDRGDLDSILNKI